MDDHLSPKLKPLWHELELEAPTSFARRFCGFWPGGASPTRSKPTLWDCPRRPATIRSPAWLLMKSYCDRRGRLARGPGASRSRRHRAAAYLRVSEAELLGLIEAGEIQARKIGDDYRLMRQVLKAWLGGDS